MAVVKKLLAYIPVSVGIWENHWKQRCWRKSSLCCHLTRQPSGRFWWIWQIQLSIHAWSTFQVRKWRSFLT